MPNEPEPHDTELMLLEGAQEVCRAIGVVPDADNCAAVTQVIRDFRTAPTSCDMVWAWSCVYWTTHHLQSKRPASVARRRLKCQHVAQTTDAELRSCVDRALGSIAGQPQPNPVFHELMKMREILKRAGEK